MADTVGYKTAVSWKTGLGGKDNEGVANYVKRTPITGATYILLAKEKTDVNKSVIKFFDWAFTYGDETAKKLDYVPLPKSVKDRVRNYWKIYKIKSVSPSVFQMGLLSYPNFFKNFYHMG